MDKPRLGRLTHAYQVVTAYQSLVDECICKTQPGDPCHICATYWAARESLVRDWSTIGEMLETLKGFMGDPFASPGDIDG